MEEGYAMKGTNEKEGIFYAALAYIIWGFFPLYWKLLQNVTAGEVLAQRIIWSFVFMLVLLLVMKKWQAYVDVVKELVRKPTLCWSLCAASVLITANWGIFIWAVNEGRILETSLGYYMNPLISVLLGVVVLKEKLSRAQVIAFILAGIGVLVLSLYFGTAPWVAFGLAFSFALYSLVKKMIVVEAAIGLTLETMMMMPVALGYILYMMSQSQAQFFVSTSTSLLLIGGGVVTALPLLFFAKGAQKILLSTLAILQYITPTLSLAIGVFVYHEVFTTAHLLAFIFIWLALVIYTLSVTKWGHARIGGVKHKRRKEA